MLTFQCGSISIPAPTAWSSFPGCSVCRSVCLSWWLWADWKQIFLLFFSLFLIVRLHELHFDLAGEKIWSSSSNWCKGKIWILINIAIPMRLEQHKEIDVFSQVTVLPLAVLAWMSCIHQCDFVYKGRCIPPSLLYFELIFFHLSLELEGW